MRWRMYIFLLSGTAAFCFMLLTAVTDYGDRNSYQPALISAVTAQFPSPTPLEPDRAVRVKMPGEGMPKPNALPIFIPSGADPVMARSKAETAENANRGKPGHRDRVKWDENGWYREEVALVTAYCPCSKCCGTQSPGITSIGKNAWTPGLAADPLYLDYGTRVFIPEYGLSVIDDTGGAMRRHWRRNGLLHIDVRMTYHYEARQWGSHYLRVKIYDEE